MLVFLVCSIGIMLNTAMGRNDSETEVAVLVRRRDRDMTEYFQDNQFETKVTLLSCSEGKNVTYLVVENQCIENMYLFNGKMKQWPIS